MCLVDKGCLPPPGTLLIASEFVDPVEFESAALGRGDERELQARRLDD